MIAEKRALWWDAAAAGGDADSGSFVELSERFSVEATEAPVTLNIRVLRVLRSPFEIDLYVWLTAPRASADETVTVASAGIAPRASPG